MVALGQSINGLALGLSALKLLFFLVLCFVIGIYIVPTFLKRITPLLNDEMLLLITVSLCFRYGAAGNFVGLFIGARRFSDGFNLVRKPV